MICDLAFGSLYFHTELLIQKNITCSILFTLFSAELRNLAFGSWFFCKVLFYTGFHLCIFKVGSFGFFWAHSQAMRKR